MDETKIQNGLVGFFDILGYQSFLENNDAEIATSKIIDIINDVGNTVSSQLFEALRTLSQEQKDILNSIQWLVFSDTILMLMKWDKKEGIPWMLYTAAASKLCRHMFEFGLPLRGAITTGSYLVSKSCFAGKTIVDAYRTAASLDLAACSIDGEIVSIVRQLYGEDEGIVTYMTPLKDGNYKKMALLNYLMPDNDESERCASDIQQLVLNSFWAHNKDISPSANIKAEHTVNFIRFLRFKFPEYFKN